MAKFLDGQFQDAHHISHDDYIKLMKDRQRTCNLINSAEIKNDVRKRAR